MFNNIQLLRAFAAILVFLFHAVPQYHAMGGRWTDFESMAGVGFAGVDIFFVISGFVAALSTLNKDRTTANAVEFLRRRVIRIYLGYWPFWGTALIVFLAVGAFPISGFDLVGSFFLTSLDMPRLVLYVSWSLTYELLFYLLVAASLWVSVRRVIWSVHIATVLLAGVLLLKWGEPLSPTFIFLAFLLEFFSGVLLFIHREALRSRALIGLCVVAVFCAFWLGVTKSATDGVVRSFTFGAGAFFLVMLAVILEQSRTWIASQFWVGLGDASYTLYLVHLILLVIFASQVRGLLTVQPEWVREVGFFGFLVLSVGCSRLLYLRWELPLYRWAIQTVLAPKREAGGLPK
jgi:peptidoglycan/LPS O-acetylase OafA/YrhL